MAFLWNGALVLVSMRAEGVRGNDTKKALARAPIAEVDSWKRVGELRITGEIAQPTTLLKGESPSFSMVVDRSTGIAQADFLGTTVLMRLDSHA